MKPCPIDMGELAVHAELQDRGGLHGLTWLVHTHFRFQVDTDVCVQGWALLSAPREAGDRGRTVISHAGQAAVSLVRGRSPQLSRGWWPACGRAQCLHPQGRGPGSGCGGRTWSQGGGSGLGLSFFIEFLGGDIG